MATKKKKTGICRACGEPIVPGLAQEHRGCAMGGARVPPGCPGCGSTCGTPGCMVCAGTLTCWKCAGVMGDGDG